MNKTLILFIDEGGKVYHTIEGGGGSTGFILVDCKNTVIFDEYLPTTKSGKPSKQDLTLQLLYEIKDKLSQQPQQMFVQPPARARQSMTYIIGEGVKGKCPRCGRQITIPAVPSVEEKRPPEMDLPCGCGWIDLEYIGG